MAHEIEKMFSVRETPWHGLGTIVSEAPSTEQAIELAGLNWKVEKEALFLKDGNVAPAFALLRDSDRRVLSVVGKSYTPLQNDEAFRWFNPFVESGECSLETAGSLRQGERVWILAKLNRTPIDVGSGDLVNKFLLLSNGHDGLIAARVSLTPIRVVCANTLAMAHGSGQSKFMRVRHSSKIVETLDKVRDIINTANASFEATAEQYRYLATRAINTKDLEQYVKKVFALPEIAESERAQTFQDHLMSDITKLFEYGRGQELASAKGTMWGAYNAVTEYLSYQAGKARKVELLTDQRNVDNRMNSLWFGANRKLNEEALTVAVKGA
jgi:phage/plasmid-like protein (TIGR03299 family)